MGIVKFFQRLRDKRFAKYVAEEELKTIEKTDSPPPEFSDIVHAESSDPIMVPRDTKQHGEVTGFYQTVSASLQEVIDEKKKGQEAAKRITNAIGAPPEPPPRQKKH